MSSDSIIFSINGIKYNVNGIYAPDCYLVDFIRKEANLTGTKYMCRQGGCGVCIVSVKKINPLTREEDVFSINSCLVPVPACHGWEITTIEGIGSKIKGYHPIQKRLADYNGTQCGFCSPGWVMRMYSLMKNKNNSLSTEEIEDAFGGNLCRCTGYRSIADAFKSLATKSGDESIHDVEDLNNLKECPKSCMKTNCCKTKTLKQNDKLEDTSDDDWQVINEDFKSIDVEERKIVVNFLNSLKWVKVFTIVDIFNIMATTTNYKLAAGNTGHALYETSAYPDISIDITGVEELNNQALEQNLIIGAGLTLENLLDVFKGVSVDNEEFSYLETFAEHLNLVAHPSVRNIATVGGNLALKHDHREFQSDIFLLLETAGAIITLMTAPTQYLQVSLEAFLHIDLRGKLIYNVLIPPMSKISTKVKTFKVIPRSQNALAIVNAGFLFKFHPSTNTIKECRIVYGNISPDFVHASKTEEFLKGKEPFNNHTLQEALRCLRKEIIPISSPPNQSPEYRKSLALTLFYKAIISFCPDSIISKRIKSGGNELKRGISSGLQYFDTHESMWPVNQPIPKIDGLVQCAGESEYVNDLLKQPDEVFAAFVLSTVAKGKILNFYTSKAMALDGVVAFYTHKDIPGKNSFTPKKYQQILEDEEVLCSGDVLYHGQPIAFIVATREDIADKAAKLVEVEYDVPIDYKPVLTLEDVFNAPDAASSSRSTNKNKILSFRIEKVAFKKAKSRGYDVDKVIKGEINIKEQYHFTMETYMAIAKPVEDGIDVYVPSLLPEGVNIAVADFLGLNVSQVTVIVRRVGGAYGAKITRIVSSACIASLVSLRLGKVCRIIMSLEASMTAFGKRVPNVMNYEVGVDKTGVIQYLNKTIYTMEGCSKNERMAQKIITSIANCYDDSTWGAIIKSVNTDKPSNTWFRAPGSLEAISFTEHIMERIAQSLNKDAIDVRLRNMAKSDNPIPELINIIKKDANYDIRKLEVNKFNSEHRWIKRAIKLMPMTYKMEYYGPYRILVSIMRTDGSIAIMHSGTEMGQGLNTKLLQVVAYELKVPIDVISIKPNNSSVVANCFGSVNSVGSESICYAAIKACKELLERLKPFTSKLDWKHAVAAAYEANVDLEAMAFVTNPELTPYNVYGVTILELELDLLTGQHNIIRVDITEDTGQSLSPEIDIGQIEGAFVMGLGYFTTEEIIFDPRSGEQLTQNTWFYHPPGIKDIPMDFRIYFRRNANNPAGILNSKGTGEPPLVMSAVVTFALWEAVKEGREEAGRYLGQWFDIEKPCTVEHTMLAVDHQLEELVLY